MLFWAACQVHVSMLNFPSLPRRLKHLTSAMRPLLTGSKSSSGSCSMPGMSHSRQTTHRRMPCRRLRTGLLAWKPTGSKPVTMLSGCSRQLIRHRVKLPASCRRLWKPRQVMALELKILQHCTGTFRSLYQAVGRLQQGDKAFREKGLQRHDSLGWHCLLPYHGL